MAEEEVRQTTIRPPLFTPHSAPMRMEAGRERLSKPFSRVTLKNTGAQTHVIIDRHQQGIELRGGDIKNDVEMLNEEIAHLQKQRAPGRLYDPDGKGLRERPQHPVVVEGVGDMIAQTEADEHAKWQMIKRLEAAEQRKFLREQLALLEEGDQENDQEPELRPRPKGRWPKGGRV